MGGPAVLQRCVFRRLVQMSVSHLTQLGIVNGITETTFSPNKEVTRAEFAKMLSLMAGANLSASHGVTPFNDVETNAWYAPAAQWASDRGIVMGRSEDQFCPEDSITREEAAVMLYRLAETENSDLLTGSTFYGQSQFQDAEEISDWAQNQVEKMQGIGILQGDNDRFRPQATILRSEAAKMLSTFLFLDRRPTLITGTTPLTYIETEPATTASISDESDEADSDESFHSQWAEEALAESDIVTPSWKSGGSFNQSTHKRLTNEGFYILFQDKSGSISNIYGKYSDTAQQYVWTGCVEPDTDPDENGPNKTFVGHYCSPSLTNKKHESSPTAYTNFNNHYYDAKVYYSNANFPKAYNSLGRSIHYMEDINSPPHAALVQGSAHQSYEAWVRDNMRPDYFVSNAPASTYNFMSTTTFRNISINFATLTNDVADACINARSVGSTRVCLVRAQRGVAGLLYRFLIDTGRNN